MAHLSRALLARRRSFSLRSRSSGVNPSSSSLIAAAAAAAAAAFSLCLFLLPLPVRNRRASAADGTGVNPFRSNEEARELLRGLNSSTLGDRIELLLKFIAAEKEKILFLIVSFFANTVNKHTVNIAHNSVSDAVAHWCVFDGRRKCGLKKLKCNTLKKISKISSPAFSTNQRKTERKRDSDKSDDDPNLPKQRFEAQLNPRIPEARRQKT